MALERSTPVSLPCLVRSNWDARIWIEGVGEAERRLEVTPAIASWDRLSVRSYTFRAGQVIDGESAEDEMSMILLSGAVSIAIDGPSGPMAWTCDGRESVFDGAPFALYLPPGHTYRTTVHRDADCLYGRSPAQGVKSPRLLRPEEFQVGSDASGNLTRRILDTAITEHLSSEEVVVDPGSWALVTSPESQGRDESELEQVRYVRAEPPTGWGMQRVDREDGDVGSVLVRSGDAVILRGGGQPLVAAPASTLYVVAFASE
jgi:5-deoxy-glucuronate isomerase